MAGDAGTAASRTQAARCVHFTRTREQAAGQRIGDVMVRRPKTLPAEATVGDVRRKLENPSLRNVILLDGTAFAGLVDRGQVPADAPDSAPARQFAASDVPMATADVPVPDVLAAMDAGQLSRLVVLDADGRTFAGLVCLDHEPSMSVNTNVTDPLGSPLTWPPRHRPHQIARHWVLAPPSTLPASQRRPAPARTARHETTDPPGRHVLIQLTGTHNALSALRARPR